MTHGLYDILVFAAGFAVIAIASRQIGGYITDIISLPLITGFLFTGIVAGPYVLNLITADAVRGLRFVDELSLSFIAFAAGNALYTKELKPRARSIAWITICLVVSTLLICAAATFALAPLFPFTERMPPAGGMAVALLAASIFIARSPSSVIAVVKELRARGPFTQTVLGVTMITDVVVIALFATFLATADSLLSGHAMDSWFILPLVFDLSLSLAAGLLLARIFTSLLSLRVATWVKTAAILLSGYGVYELSEGVRLLSADGLAFEIVPEPLLICMVAGFAVGNSDFRMDFSKVISDAGPPVYIAFFTLTGASLELGVLAHTWQIALALLVVRAVAIVVGAVAGGLAAGDPKEHNLVGWMAYITQAGVSLGLAKAVAVEFPAWGGEFATTMIAIIIMNQLIGPPLLKRAIEFVGEAHTKGTAYDYERREALILGLEPQSLALGRMLVNHGWTVRIGCTAALQESLEEPDLKIVKIPDLSLETLESLDAGKASAIVAMMSDDENHRICELAYEHFGAASLVVRINDRENIGRFHELGAVVVDPETALVGLMDQFVRSPTAASLLLGMEKGQEVAELELRNPNLHGVPLRELRLPLSTIILSIRRQGQAIISHGYTRLEVGDMVTVVGPPESLKEVELRFDTDQEQALAYIVERAASKEIAPRAAKETAGIKAETERMDRFDRFIEQAVVIDLPKRTTAEEFFKIASEPLSATLGVPSGRIYELLVERESQGSTAITRGLAIPHIIVEETDRFAILLARCRQGIRFSEQAPMVPAVFVLAGPKKERNFHLQALAAIAQVVQSHGFEKRWLSAKDDRALRNVVISARRKKVI